MLFCFGAESLSAQSWEHLKRLLKRLLLYRLFFFSLWRWCSVARAIRSRIRSIGQCGPRWILVTSCVFFFARVSGVSILLVHCGSRQDFEHVLQGRPDALRLAL